MAKGVELATAYVSVIPSMRGFKDKVRKGYSDAVGGLGDDAESKGGGIGSKFASGMGAALKRGAMVAGGAAGAALGYTLKKGFDRLSAIEGAEAKLKGLGHTTEGVSTIMDSALSAVKGTAYGLGEAASVAAGMVAAGIQPGDELTQVLKTVGDVAAISGRSIDDVGLIFQSVAARGKLQGDDMLQLMSSGIPVLQLLAEETGKTSEEVSDMVTKGQIDFATFERAMRNGMGGAALEMGNTVSGAISNMNAAIGRLGEVLLNGAFKAAPAVIGRVTDAIDGLTDKVKGAKEYFETGVRGEAFTKAFGDQEQADRVAALLDNLHRKFTQFMAGIRGEQTSGALGALGEALRNIWDAAVKAAPAVGKIMASLAEAGATASIVSLTSVLSTLAPILADILVPILEALSTLMRENQDAVNFLVTAATGLFVFNKVLGPVNGFFGALVKLKEPLKLGAWLMKEKGGAALLLGRGLEIVKGKLAALFPNLAKFVGALKSLGPKLKDIAGLLSNGIHTAILSVTRAVKGLWLALSANPFVAVAALIAGVVAGLVYFFTQTEKGKELWDKFTNFLTEAWELIKIAAQITWDTIVSAVTGAWQWVTDSWGGAVEWFTNLWEGIKTAFALGWQGVSEAGSSAWDWITNMWGGAAEWFSGMWNGVKEVSAGAWQAISETVLSWWDSISSGLKSGWEGVSGWFSSAWDGFKSMAGSVWGSVSDTISSAWDGISSKVTSTWEHVGGWLSSAWDGLKQKSSNTWTSIKDGVASAWDSVSNKTSEAWGWVQNSTNVSWDSIEATVSQTWSTIVDSTFNAWDSMTSGISSGVDWALSSIRDFASGAWDNVNSAVDAFWGFPKQVMNAFSNAGNWLYNAGVNIINGLLDGIYSSFEAVQNALNSLTDMLPDWKGPEPVDKRILRPAGQLVIGGFQEGLESQYRNVQRSLGGFTKSLETDVPVPVGVAHGGGVTFNIGAINNPVEEPSSTSLSRELSKAAAGVGALA